MTMFLLDVGSMVGRGGRASGFLGDRLRAVDEEDVFFLDVFLTPSPIVAASTPTDAPGKGSKSEGLIDKQV